MSHVSVEVEGKEVSVGEVGDLQLVDREVDGPLIASDVHVVPLVVVQQAACLHRRRPAQRRSRP